MKLIRCDGSPRHYYDGDIYSECPECKKMNAIGSGSVKTNTTTKKEHTRNETLSLEQVQQRKNVTFTPSSDAKNPFSDLSKEKPEQAGLLNKIFGKKKDKSPSVLNNENDTMSMQDDVKSENEQLSISEDSISLQPIINPTSAASAPPSIVSEIAAVQNTQQNANKTVAYYSFGGNEPVVGWLVCLKGVYKGESFNLKTGQNFIGRSLNMDIVLKDEASVSRENHSMIMYDPKHNNFHILPGQSSSITYLNDSALFGPTLLKPYDLIALGECLLSFVPFCSELFNWDNYKD